MKAKLPRWARRCSCPKGHHRRNGVHLNNCPRSTYTPPAPKLQPTRTPEQEVERLVAADRALDAARPKLQQRTSGTVITHGHLPGRTRTEKRRGAAQRRRAALEAKWKEQAR